MRRGLCSAAVRHRLSPAGLYTWRLGARSGQRRDGASQVRAEFLACSASARSDVTGCRLRLARVASASAPLCASPKMAAAAVALLRAGAVKPSPGSRVVDAAFAVCSFRILTPFHFQKLCLVPSRLRGSARSPAQCRSAAHARSALQCGSAAGAARGRRRAGGGAWLVQCGAGSGGGVMERARARKLECGFLQAAS
ncbi:SNRPN upstream reading frame protein isoform X2 [Cavia porcellus]|uniref:SNRPN upstream reading frame protein isoform X2 n=1 Tax=Cavia porcellus TaxID=10141 RepID=UPI002FE0F8EE